jgi:leucyl-tRNA synthetase
MGVPAHDQRDFDFAKEIKLPIKFIIETKDHSKAYEDDGKHINSEFINGLNNEQAKQTINK